MCRFLSILSVIFALWRILEIHPDEIASSDKSTLTNTSSFKTFEKKMQKNTRNIVLEHFKKNASINYDFILFFLFFLHMIFIKEKTYSFSVFYAIITFFWSRIYLGWNKTKNICIVKINDFHNTFPPWTLSSFFRLSSVSSQNLKGINKRFDMPF